MLAVVGAVIMLVVGNSLSRAFGIVGAAGLIRYRSTIADPKDAVVMLSSLASGLAVGVGLFKLGAVATVFMMLALWLVEYFEPPARKLFELRLKTSDAAEFRAKAEDVLKALGLEHELMVEDEDEIRYNVSAPVNVRTKDVSDTLKPGRRRQRGRQVGRAAIALAITRYSFQRFGPICFRSAGPSPSRRARGSSEDSRSCPDAARADPRD